MMEGMERLRDERDGEVARFLRLNIICEVE